MQHENDERKEERLRYTATQQREWLTIHEKAIIREKHNIQQKQLRATTLVLSAPFRYLPFCVAALR